VKTAGSSEKTVRCCSRAVRPDADPPDKKKAAPDGDQGAATSKATAANKYKSQDQNNRRAAALQARFVPLNKMQRAWIEPPKRVRSRRARYHQEPKRPWVRLFLDVLEHDAYRGLSINARRAYDALICHLHRSGSIENGSLDVSHKTFEGLGVTHRYVASALRELEDAGLIWSSRAEQKHPLLPTAKRYGVTAYADETKRAFAWVYLDFLESKSYRGLSINARRVLERLLIKTPGTDTKRTAISAFHPVIRRDPKRASPHCKSHPRTARVRASRHHQGQAKRQVCSAESLPIEVSRHDRRSLHVAAARGRRDPGKNNFYHPKVVHGCHP
jgi:hypothetical protein